MKRKIFFALLLGIAYSGCQELEEEVETKEEDKISGNYSVKTNKVRWKCIDSNTGSLYLNTIYVETEKNGNDFKFTNKLSVSSGSIIREYPQEGSIDENNKFSIVRKADFRFDQFGDTNVTYYFYGDIEERDSGSHRWSGIYNYSVYTVDYKNLCEYNTTFYGYRSN
ncbi:MAG: hypothetical protein OIF32_09615 [Campylobacterales bacterium]|nr:hypothetical protein [Campylobacterales bacterium]